MGHALGNNYGKTYSFGSKPVFLDLNFIVDDTNASGVSTVQGQGVKNVYMVSETTPATGNPMVDDVSEGYCLIELDYNYTRLYGSFTQFTCPTTGSNLAINASALTAGVPYTITSVGHGTAGAATIQPVPDVSGNLAGTYFSVYDAYGNTFIIWFSVSGVGSAPTGVAGTLVQQSIFTNDTAATIGADLVLTLQNLPSGLSGVSSFTAAGTTTVTYTSTTSLPFRGGPADGANATGFTFALTKYTTNLTDWQKVGLPQGVTPAVGVSFVATAIGYSTGGGSTGLVKANTVTGISHAEVIGDPNLSLGPIPMGGSPNSGGWILLKFLGPTLTMASYTPAGVITNGSPDSFAGTPATLTGTVTFTPTAPANGTKINFTAYLEQGARIGGNNE